jgi:hypothetical protein
MPRHLQDKRVSTPSIPLRTALLPLPLLGLVFAGVCVSQQPAGRDLREQQLEDAYAKHDAKIRQLLPPYSGPPLLLDLSHGRDDGVCDPEQHAAWEKHFNGIMDDTYVVDRGFSDPADATATTFTTTDTFGPIYSLPAKRSFAIVIAQPLAGRVCIPQSRNYVYTKFTLRVLKEFRKGKDNRREESQKTDQLTAVEFGGSVRFRSGFLETFLLNQEGFVQIGKQYVLFMWKAVPSDDMLVISQAYLIQDGLIFPVSSNGDAQTVYTKMPLPEFEAKVQAAVERNADLDLLPQVHAPTR